MVSNYLELLLILGEEDRGAEDRNAWPPTLPPLLAAEASSTVPRVNTPAANVTIANFANWFSFFLGNSSTHNEKSHQTKQ